jgi:hypothetical protein
MEEFFKQVKFEFFCLCHFSESWRIVNVSAREPRKGEGGRRFLT